MIHYSLNLSCLYLFVCAYFCTCRIIIHRLCRKQKTGFVCSVAYHTVTLGSPANLVRYVVTAPEEYAAPVGRIIIRIVYRVYAVLKQAEYIMQSRTERFSVIQPFKAVCKRVVNFLIVSLKSRTE